MDKCFGFEIAKMQCAKTNLYRFQLIHVPDLLNPMSSVIINSKGRQIRVLTLLCQSQRQQQQQQQRQQQQQQQQLWINIGLNHLFLTSNTVAKIFTQLTPNLAYVYLPLEFSITNRLRFMLLGKILLMLIK